MACPKLDLHNIKAQLEGLIAYYDRSEDYVRQKEIYQEFHRLEAVMKIALTKLGEKIPTTTSSPVGVGAGTTHFGLKGR